MLWFKLALYKVLSNEVLVFSLHLFIILAVERIRNQFYAGPLKDADESMNVYQRNEDMLRQEKSAASAQTGTKDAGSGSEEYRLVAREYSAKYRGNLETSRFTIRGVEVGADKPLIIAGPCAVHSYKQTIEITQSVKEAGADMLRGGAYKPRTSPYSFQGLGLKGLEILAEAREITELPIVTEVMDQLKVEEVGYYADVLQIGARNMQNYALLRDVGKYAAEHKKGVLLKTGPLPKLKEVLCAAEYLALEGAKKIIICERGINNPADSMRNTPRPNFLTELRKATYLPVIGDPSHSTGRRDLVPQIATEFLDAAANGLLIDVIRDDEKKIINDVEVCDYEQGLRASDFKRFIDKIKPRKVPQKWP